MGSSCLNDKSGQDVYVVQRLSARHTHRGRSTRHPHHISKNKKELATEQERKVRYNSHSFSLSGTLRTCAETRALTCSWTIPNRRLSTPTFHVADFVQSFESVLHDCWPSSTDNNAKSLFRSRGKFSSNFSAQSAIAVIASLYSQESGM